MNLNNNPFQRTALIWVGVMMLGIIVIFIPSIAGIDGDEGGFALSILGMLIVITGIVTCIVYLKLASALVRITKKENLLVHWTYTPEQWKEYTEREHREDTSVKKRLFIIVAIMAIIAGVVLVIINPENFIAISLVILGIIVVIGFAAFLSAQTNYRTNRKYLGEAYVALNGVYLNRQLHIWKGLGTRLESVVYEPESDSLPVIKFDYSAISRNGRDNYTIRVPVPPGQETIALALVDNISASQLKNIST